MKKIFTSMAGGPLAIPALLILPVLFAIFIGIGFTRENIIEDDVYAIWASEKSDYYQDAKYARSVGRTAGSSNLLAIATSRDGGNLMTASRLDEIRYRMEAMELVTVEHGGNTFEWKDICASNNIGLGTVYEFPCVRLTPMDLFQEASWYMTEIDRVSWYNAGIQENVVVPRIGRFGIMTSPACQAACGALLFQRISTGKTLNLFGDLTAMEMNNPCKICIESTYESTMDYFTGVAKGLFGFMVLQLQTSLEVATVAGDDAKMLQIGTLLQKVGMIYGKVDRAAIEEFFMYYTTRGIYGQLGATAYIGNYNNVNAACEGCMPPLGLPDTYAATADADLKKHADAAFSSVNTAGTPYPVTGFPQGGSGVNFTGTLFSSTGYFDLTNAQNPTAWNPKFGTTGTDGAAGVADPTDLFWTLAVETDPVYKWFMAGETKMTAHCGNTIDPNQLKIFSQWCTKFSLPLEDEERTVQHFAKLWYGLLIDSPGFLGLVEGVSDPYTYTSGEGCGYDLGGERATYKDKNESSILLAASGELYFIDEGSSVGALDKALLMGGTRTTKPAMEVSKANPYTKVASFQNIYPVLIPEGMVNRVKNCNRPRGAVNITLEDAQIVIEEFKQTLLDAWSAGWDDEDEGEVQFTGFFDSVGTPGTFNFVLRDISNDSGSLTLISVAIIAALSMLFLANTNAVQSRIGITLVGVILVLISFVGALGFAILVGIKININMAWTLPFIMIGLGVDDMYIVLNAMKEQGGYTDHDFVAAMQSIIAPVTMTSLVNASMFAVMNIVDIGAIYKTAQAALIAIIFLYLSIILCFPAYCYLDMKRQEAKRCDIIICVKGQDDGRPTERRSFLFGIYRSLFLAGNVLSMVMQAVVVVGTIAIFVLGCYGISERKVGVGLAEFFPTSHQASRWAEIRNKDLAAWPIGIVWGAVDYKDPESQLLMMKQYEDIVDTKYVTRKDTKWLWIASFNLWTTRHCQTNFNRDDPLVKECGSDQLFVGKGDEEDTNTACAGTWVENTIGLKERTFTSLDSTECSLYRDGICRPGTEMFAEDLDAINGVTTKSYCPVFEGWSEPKLKFCLQKWREFTGGSGGLLVEEGTATPFVNDDETCPGGSGEFIPDDEVQSPIPISNSPTLYANKLFTHEDTVEMIKETRAICDKNEKIHCFMAGIPFDFWEQYLTVNETLALLSGVAVAVGFVVATVFLFLELDPASDDFGSKEKAVASLCGGLLIACTIIVSLVPVIGISMLLNVNLTAFSNMAFVLSVSFATEYSVHVVHRFLSAPTSIRSAAARVEYTMKFLTQPLTLSFLSSTAGVSCLAFTDFEFNERFFFRPLMVVMVMTYIIGAFFLPILLTKLDFDFLKVGHKGEAAELGLVDEHFKDDKLEEA